MDNGDAVTNIRPPDAVVGVLNLKTAFFSVLPYVTTAVSPDTFTLTPLMLIVSGLYSPGPGSRRKFAVRLRDADPRTDRPVDVRAAVRAFASMGVLHEHIGFEFGNREFRSCVGGPLQRAAANADHCWTEIRVFRGWINSAIDRCRQRSGRSTVDHCLGAR